MKYRVDKESLFNVIRGWDAFLKKRVRLIACGGTALTLLRIKASTKDIDLMVPNLDEYDYLIKILKQLGYKHASGWGWRREDGFVFDLFPGKRIHTTELLESPLNKDNHILIKEFTYIYLGALNYYDIIISKLFRATQIDIEDCLSLLRAKGKEIDFKFLEKRFRETASFDVSEDKINRNFDHFLKILREEGVVDEK